MIRTRRVKGVTSHRCESYLNGKVLLHWLGVCKAFSCALKISYSIAKKRTFLRNPKSNILRIPDRLQRTRFQMKAYHSTFVYWVMNWFYFHLSFQILTKKLLFDVNFFFKIYVFSQHICLLSENEVSNESLFESLSISAKKNLKKTEWNIKW